MNSLISKAFSAAKKENRPALLTYTVAGDNTKKKSLEILKSISNYADICELGFPHNTPIADGGQIQTSAYRAIKNGIKMKNVFEIVKIFKDWINQENIDVIITTGGTGLTGRDITPEAINEIADKHIPGFGEVFRTISLKTVGTSAIQSRACAVLANGKYVFALPGSSGGVTDAWDGILKHQLDVNHKPCNFVELFPRLKEK